MSSVVHLRFPANTATSGNFRQPTAANLSWRNSACHAASVPQPGHATLAFRQKRQPPRHTRSAIGSCVLASPFHPSAAVHPRFNIRSGQQVREPRILNSSPLVACPPCPLVSARAAGSEHKRAERAARQCPRGVRRVAPPGQRLHPRAGTGRGVYAARSPYHPPAHRRPPPPTAAHRRPPPPPCPPCPPW
jgi:hypothetical protein